MRRLVRFLLVALLALVVILLAAGCGSNRQALRPGGPEVEFRLPPAKAADIHLREMRAREAPQPQPPSVADESKGRWLTLFEMNVTPSEAAGVAPAPEESP